MINRQDDPCGPGKFLAPTRSINIRTEIPGPKSRALSERYQAHTGAQPEIVIASAHGARVIDVDNNVYIDFASGTAVGHTHERVVAALQHQAEIADSPQPNDWQQIYDVHLQLCELLSQICPLSAPKQVELLSEYNLRLTLHIAKGETTVISCRDGFVQIPPAPSDVAIVDESSIGIGRTGTLFAYQQLDIQPAAVGIKLTDDVYALIRTQPLFQDLNASSSVSPLAAAAALEILKIVVEQNLAARATQMGEIVNERLEQWASEYPVIVHLRGIGGQHGFRLHRRSHESFVARARENGLLLNTHAIGEYIPLLYPLMIPEEQLYEGLDVLEFLFEKISE